MKRRPRPGRRPLARRVLVVTEGTRTEPQYVEGLDAYLRSHGASTVVRTVSVGRDPLKVVQRSVELREDATRKGKEYDDCVCLVDVDEHSSLPAATKLANAQGIQLLVSNLKFEVWLRWHVEPKRSALSSRQLDELVNRLGLLHGKRLSPHFPFEKVDDACAVARAADPELKPGRVGPDPSTALPVLVSLMRGEQSLGPA